MWRVIETLSQMYWRNGWTLGIAAYLLLDINYTLKKMIKGRERCNTLSHLSLPCFCGLLFYFNRFISWKYHRVIVSFTSKEMINNLISIRIYSAKGLHFHMEVQTFCDNRHCKKTHVFPSFPPLWWETRCFYFTLKQITK